MSGGGVDVLANPIPHIGVFLPANPNKEGGGAYSFSDKTVTITIEGTNESLSFGAKVSTTCQEVVDLVKAIVRSDADVSIKVRTGTRLRKLKMSDEVTSHMIVGGVSSFRSGGASGGRKQYDHPIAVIGAGLGGIQSMIDLRDRGRTDIVCIERYPDFGGHSWIAVPNRFTKLQTEKGTYAVNYIRINEPCPQFIGDLPYRTWPSRDVLLQMMRTSAREYGLEKYCCFNTSLEKVQEKNGNYILQNVPCGENQEDADAEILVASAVVTWPGFLHLPNEVDFPGEDDFGGYIEYSSFDKVDYSKTVGKTITLYGHGAFTIENVRTLCEHRCKKVYVLCRTRNLAGMKMGSWLVGAMVRPVPANVLLDCFSKIYDLVGFDVWSAHSVQTDEKRSYAQITQKTIFGVTDIYFLAGYYGLMECVVDEVKRLTYHCVNTKKYKKLECDCFIKAIGTKPTFKVDKEHAIKELVGYWINGDCRRPISPGNKGVAAKNFGSFSVGPGLAPLLKILHWFVDYPDTFALVKDQLPRNKASEWPAYVVQSSYGMPVGVLLSTNLPALAMEMGAMDQIKSKKQWETHPLPEYLNECKTEWEAYIKFFRANNMVDDRPDPPYPYTMEVMEGLMARCQDTVLGVKAK